MATKPIGTGPLLTDELRAHLDRAKKVAGSAYYLTSRRKTVRKHLVECITWFEAALLFAEERDKQMRLMVQRHAEMLDRKGVYETLPLSLSHHRPLRQSSLRKKISAFNRA